MTSLFLFLTITGMIHSSHICQRDHIQKKIKSPYPPYNAPPNLAPWCLSNLSMLPTLPTFQSPWPLCISGTFRHAHIGPQIFPRFHLSFNLYLFVQKLLLWEASPVTPFRIATSVIFYPSNPLYFFLQSTYFKLTLTLYYLPIWWCVFPSRMRAPWGQELCPSLLYLRPGT